MVVMASPREPERVAGRADPLEAARTGASLLQYALLFVVLISFYLTILLDIVGAWSWFVVAGLLGLVALRSGDRTTRVLAVYPLVFLFYVAARRLADDGFAPSYVDYVVAADRILGLGRVPTVALQETLGGPLAAAEPLLVGIYVSFFFAFVLTVPLLFWLDRGGAERMLAGGVLVFLIGLPIHWAVPTAPPWMAALQGQIGEAPRILHDGWLGAQTTVYELGTDASGNDVAAMPSYHMALTVLVSLAWARVGRGWAILGWAYAAVMAFALVYGAEHWVIDLIVGGAVAAVAWRGAPWLLDRLRPGGAPGEGKGRPATAAGT